jgi:hypothetical protein
MAVWLAAVETGLQELIMWGKFKWALKWPD